MRPRINLRIRLEHDPIRSDEVGDAFGKRDQGACGPDGLRQLVVVIAEQSARGKGYAKEATGLLVGYLFSRFPTERVSAGTDIENVGAQRVLESLGFKQEGTIRRSMFRGGKWGDALIYGVLREEWEKGHPTAT